MLTIKAQWKDYEESCIPDGTPDSDRDSVRTTFYAGAMGVLGMLQELQGLSIEQINDRFYSMTEEIQEFNRQLNESS